MEPSMEGQDMGLEDPSLSLHSAVPPLGQESSRQEFEQWSHQSEHSDRRVQEYVQKDQYRASHQDTLDTISGRSSKPLEVSNQGLGFVRECKLRDRYQTSAFLCVDTAKVCDRLNVVLLAPEQQKFVDNGCRTTSEPWVDHSHNNHLKT